MNKRRIAVIIGSDSDLPQCWEGLMYLAQMQEEGKVEVVRVMTMSVHRNTEALLSWLLDNHKSLDAIVVGAGWANALTGMCDAYSRYAIKDEHLVVVGVAFIDPVNTNHTQAAILGITELPPGAQVVYNGYLGSRGFVEACQFAVEDTLPPILLKDAKPVQDRTLDDAIARAEIEIQKAKQKSTTK